MGALEQGKTNDRASLTSTYRVDEKGFRPDDALVDNQMTTVHLY